MLEGIDLVPPQIQTQNKAGVGSSQLLKEQLCVLRCAPQADEAEPGLCLVGAHPSGIKILCGVILICNCSEGLLSPQVSETCFCSRDALFSLEHDFE